MAPTAAAPVWCPPKRDVRGDGRLRYGARIDVTHQGQTIQLLSVHLKSGCFENASTSSDCTLLLEQIPVLEG